MVRVLQVLLPVLLLLGGSLLFADSSARAVGDSSARAEPVRQLSHRDRLYDVTMVDGEIYVVGHPGLLLRSRDGGKSFESVPAGLKDEALFSVAFNKKGQGAVVGRSGIFLTTLDHGKTWEKGIVKLGEEHPSLFSVDVLDDGTIVAVGEFGAIARSEDHGKTWSRSSYTIQVEAPAKASASAPAKASGKKRGRRAAKAAAPEAPEAAQAAAPEPSCVTGGEAEAENADVVQESRLTDVSFFDATRGLIVAEFGLVLLTEDGGRTFKRQASCTDKILYSVHAMSPSRALAAGAEGTIIETSDGGRTWARRSSGTIEHLFGVWADESRAMVLGAAGTALAREGTAAFKLVDTGVHSWLTGAALDDKGRGVIVGGRGYVRRTEDGGNTQHRVLGE